MRPMENTIDTTSSRSTDRPTDARERARSVSGVHRATPPHWVGDGFFVSTYFPSARLPAERVSPFLLMDYGPPRDFPALARGQRGVGWHPHRGFETVTVAWEGAVEHGDSAGHVGIIGPGDVQWMTAASGILHKEYLETEFTRRGGRLHMMQLWVNLPARDKMSPPGYQPIVAAQIPTVSLDSGSTVRVIAGEYAGSRGPARTFTPVLMLDARLAAGATLSVPLPARYNALGIVTSGRVSAGERTASAGELILFGNDGAHAELRAEAEAHVLFLAGEPIDEPIVQYGPFVMNTKHEIVQAMRDFERGDFGEIPESERHS
jgi:quercetin 2,3-dioxygenase